MSRGLRADVQPLLFFASEVGLGFSPGNKGRREKELLAPGICLLVPCHTGANLISSESGLSDTGILRPFAEDHHSS